MRGIRGVRLAAIGGIWAKSHRQPYYVTDEDVAAAAAKIAASGPLDLLLTHGCPVGLADRTPRNLIYRLIYRYAPRAGFRAAQATYRAFRSIRTSIKTLRRPEPRAAAR